MKKRILILLIMMLLTTGCTCEYNLTIDGNTYKEEIIFTAETQDEVSSFNTEFEIPIDKDEYNQIASSDSTDFEIEGDIYKHNLSNNRLTFNYDFSQSQYINSTAVSNCYNKLTVLNYNNTIVISSSPKVECFEKYSSLTNLKVNIKIDRPVISHNSDNISGNIYTWNITKDNANNKSINLVLDNNRLEQDSNIKDPSIDNEEPTNNNNNNKNKNDYTIYIFFAILALIIFLGYKWFMKFKEKNNNID